MSVHVCTCIHTWAWKLQVDGTDLQLRLHLILGSRISQSNLPGKVSLAGQLVLGFCLCSGLPHLLGIFLGSGDLDSVSLACTTDTLTAKHLPSPRLIFSSMERHCIVFGEWVAKLER